MKKISNVFWSYHRNFKFVVFDTFKQGCQPTEQNVYNTRLHISPPSQHVIAGRTHPSPLFTKTPARNKKWNNKIDRATSITMLKERKDKFESSVREYKSNKAQEN